MAEKKDKKASKVDRPKKPDLNNKHRDNKGKSKFNLIWIYGLIVVAFIIISYISKGGGPMEITWQRFESEMLRSFDIEKLEVINKQKVEIYIKQEKLNSGKYTELFNKGFGNVPARGPHYFFEISSVDIFHNQLNEAQENFPAAKKVLLSY